MEGLSADVLNAIMETQDASEKISTLASAMGVRHYQDNSRSAILVDFCFYNLLFCEEHNFTPEQASAFFAIMKRVFEHAFESKAKVTMEESFAFFKQQMLVHSVEAPPDSVAIFEPGDVQHVADFISKSFYRHFKAHEYCFSNKRGVARSTRAIVVETPCAFPPLEEALQPVPGDSGVR